MAFHKLPFSLFSAKAGITPTEGSTQCLHFLASVRQSRNQYAFVCESDGFAASLLPQIDGPAIAGVTGSGDQKPGRQDGPVWSQRDGRKGFEDERHRHHDSSAP